MAPPSAAAALRDSFGDRKLPDITRKITACVACRQAKIKCHMNGSKPPCSRCKARGPPCTVNKSIQMLLENDLGWKEVMERRVEQIELSLISGANLNSRPSSARVDSLKPPPSKSPSGAGTTVPSQMESLDELPDTLSDITLNLSCSLGAFPASSLENFTLSQAGCKPDLISSGSISQDSAEEHFRFYHENLNPYIHHILSEKDSLANMRSRSSLLTAAVCTTAALCAGSADYQNCLNAFTHEVSGKLFSTHHTFDDVRALCIGALWLNDISFALNALAIRIAAELNLHRCITKMPHRKRECCDRTRLYFLVYICDHHCSLSHGRPPMTRTLRSLKAPRALLQGGFSTPHDLNLISQVELWSISSRVFDIFGADIESSFVQNKSAELEQLSGAYGRWRQEWVEVLTLRVALDQFSQLIFDLYYHSTKLYLFSHVLRGPAQRGAKPQVTTNGMDSFAQCAVENALSIIRCVSEGNENQVWLGNLPCYFGKVTAFASILLLCASWQAQHLYKVEEEEVFNCLRRLTESIQGSLVAIHPVHPLWSIANSLEIAIGSRWQSNCDGMDGNGGDKPTDLSLDFDLFGEDLFGLGFLDNRDDWLSFPSKVGSEPSTFEQS